jgi:hypothetical protein
MQGGFCTKSIDDVVPDQSSGGLRAHTVLKQSTRKLGDEAGIVPVHNVGWTESKKEVERAKTKILLDAVQEQRAKQQAAGVQRLHDQTLSRKLLRAQNGAQSASFRSRSFSMDYGSKQYRELIEGRARESFKFRLEAHQSLDGAEELADGSFPDQREDVDQSEPTRNDAVSNARKHGKITPGGSQQSSFKACNSAPDLDLDPNDPTELSSRSNPEKRISRARRESADSGEQPKKGSFKAAPSSPHNWREESADTIRTNDEKPNGDKSNGHGNGHSSAGHGHGHSSAGHGHGHSSRPQHEKDLAKHVTEGTDERTSSDPMNAQSANFISVSICMRVICILCVSVDVLFQVWEEIFVRSSLYTLRSMCICMSVCSSAPCVSV